MTEREVIDILRIEYPPPAWAFLDHVPDGTGANKLRTADAMAMGLWPSRGLELNGFEVKVHRSDWLRELKKPEKADELVSRCHRWWVVESEEDIVQAGELPPTWGLLLVEGKKTKVVVDAPQLVAEPLDWLFLAAILRRAAEAWVSKEETRKRREKLVGEEPPRPMEAAEVQKWLGQLERMQGAVSKLSSAMYAAQHEVRTGWHERLASEHRSAGGEE